MDYDGLLTLATDLGYGLLISGAEIFRVEDSIQRLLFAYGAVRVDPFVIPNCINISILTPDGATLTQIRRMPSHGNDVDSLERYNALCRKLCRETPALPEARQELDAIIHSHRKYTVPQLAVAHYVASGAFALFFGGNWRDALCSGVCGVAICLASEAMSNVKTSPYLKTMICAAISAFLALLFTHFGLGSNTDMIIIGALMALVPGITFTNSIRDVMVGDMVSGLSRAMDAIFTAVMAALGTAFVLSVTRMIWGV